MPTRRHIIAGLKWGTGFVPFPVTLLFNDSSSLEKSFLVTDISSFCISETHSISFLTLLYCFVIEKPYLKCRKVWNFLLPLSVGMRTITCLQFEIRNNRRCGIVRKNFDIMVFLHIVRYYSDDILCTVFIPFWLLASGTFENLCSICWHRFPYYYNGSSHPFRKFQITPVFQRL